MVEPVTAVLGAGYTLLQVLGVVKEVCQKKLNNDRIVQELSVFITNLNQDLDTLKQRTPQSNSGLWAAGALQQDFVRATEYVRECHQRGYIKSIWSMNTIYDKLKRIREELRFSFQTKLQIIIFDVVIEEQSKQEEFRANLSRVQGALTDALADFADDRREWKAELHQLRAELKALFSGFAFAHKDEPDKIYTFYEWPGNESKAYCKTQTGLFYVNKEEASGSKPEYQLTDWGWPGFICAKDATSFPSM